MPPKIKVNGTEYEFPDLESITLDEAVILYEDSGLTLDQVEEVGNTFHPGLLKALIHIAIVRSDPQFTKREILEGIGQLKITDLADVLNLNEEDAGTDADPPPSESDGGAETSGEPGPDDSETAPESSDPLDTGTPASATTVESPSEIPASLRRVS